MNGTDTIDIEFDDTTNSYELISFLSVDFRKILLNDIKNIEFIKQYLDECGIDNSMLFDFYRYCVSNNIIEEFIDIPVFPGILLF